jgi:hypothetical protein
VSEFRNPLYEYVTREFPTDLQSFSSAADRDMEAEGWRRTWADVTIEGTFAVYRRPRAFPVAADRAGQVRQADALIEHILGPFLPKRRT